MLSRFTHQLTRGGGDVRQLEGLQEQLLRAKLLCFTQ